MPQLIHNLIREYIKPETSIVLLTLMMNNDAHNSMGAAMIEKMDAQNRTLGVLTKPDRVGDTGVDQWRNRLSGQAFPLKLGYYVVKNPSQPKNTNHDQATFDEQEFFRNSPAFRDDLYEYSSRFGIDNLRTHLSQTLEEAIKT